MKNYYYSGYGSDIHSTPDYCDFDHLFRVMEKLKPLQAGIELNIYTDKVRNNHDGKVLELQDKLKEYPITLHGPFLEVEPSCALDSKQGRENIEAWKEGFEIGRILDAKSIVMHTNQCAVIEEKQKEMQDNVVATVEKIAEMAREYEIELYVENVGFPFANSILFPEDDFIRLFERLPEDVGCLINLGHAILNGWDLEKVIRTLGKRIKAYHIHNNEGGLDSHRPIFEAGLKYNREQMTELLETMEEITPDAEWVLEYSPGEHITPELIYDDLCAIDEIREAYHQKTH